MATKLRPDKQTFAMNSLRRASYKWRGRWMAEKKYKHEGRNRYWCAICGPEKIYGKKDVQLDHVAPVVDPLTGITTMDEWIDRLLVDEDGWQLLCKPCHLVKTQAENVVRREVKKPTTKKAKKKSRKR